jgi:hypothetical protein
MDIKVFPCCLRTSSVAIFAIGFPPSETSQLPLVYEMEGIGKKTKLINIKEILVIRFILITFFTSHLPKD